MADRSAKADSRLLSRMRDLDRRWTERDTAEEWERMTPVPVEPSPRRPEYLIAVDGPLAKALRTAARKSGEPVPDYARRVLADSLGSGT